MNLKLFLVSLFIFISLLFVPKVVAHEEDPTTSEATPNPVECPLTGVHYPAGIAEKWMKTRPLAIMLDNHKEARPHSGLSKADVVFEAQAEGGSTFLMPIYYCEAQLGDVKVAPVRSARVYFIDWAASFMKPFYVHVGGANLPGPTDALGKIQEMGWENQNDINQFSVGVPTFVRDYDRIPGKQLPTEYTMGTSTAELWKVADRRLLQMVKTKGEFWPNTYKGWSFAIEPKVASPTETTIEYAFWEGFTDSAAKWEYVKETNSYQRFSGGEKQLDYNNNQTVEAKNVIILFAEETGPVNEKKHMVYQTIGEGKALVYHDGGVEVATWKKDAVEGPLNFVSENGAPVQFTPGMTWISVLGNGVIDTNSQFKKHFPDPVVEAGSDATPTESLWQKILSFFGWR